MDMEIIRSGNFWVIGDTHFYHTKIGAMCKRPKDWQDIIIENWKNLIGKDEMILHVGDLYFGPNAGQIVNLMDFTSCTVSGCRSTGSCIDLHITRLMLR
jgi:calcineurin-like phosphoesterase family protein